MNRGVIRFVNQPKPRKDPALDDALEEMAESLSWCFSAVSKETCGYTLKQMDNNFMWIQAEKQKWQSDETETSDIVRIAKFDKPYLFEAIKQIPTTQLMKLAKMDSKRVKPTPDIKKYLQCACCLIFVWYDDALQKHRRYNLEERMLIASHMVTAVDMFAKGYITKDLINADFKKTMKYDLVKGEKVS